MIWTIIEPGLGITAASIVTLRPLLRTFNISGFTSGGSSSSRYHQHSSRGGPYARSGAHDSSALGTDALDSEHGPYILREPNSHKMNSLRASSGVATTVTTTMVVSAGKGGKMGSGSVQTYSTSEVGSQELILAPLESRDGGRGGGG
jgi:hypothetical protein